MGPLAVENVGVNSYTEIKWNLQDMGFDDIVTQVIDGTSIREPNFEILQDLSLKPCELVYGDQQRLVLKFKGSGVNGWTHQVFKVTIVAMSYVPN